MLTKLSSKLWWLVIWGYAEKACCGVVVVFQEVRNILNVLSKMMLTCGLPWHFCLDNGPELNGRTVQQYLGQTVVDTLLIESEVPWQKGYVEESFNRLI